MNIIPRPKNCIVENLNFVLNGYVFLSETADNRLVKAVAELGVVTNNVEKASVEISHGLDGDGYTLNIDEKGVNIVGEGASGAFYGIQTLKQIARKYGVNVPFCHIEDRPDFKERGFYHDVTRGKVPKLETLYKIVDELSELKINQLQLYVEDAFDFTAYRGIIPEDCKLTAEEIKALDDYCYERFIELVPSMSTFGHLYELLQSEKYRHLCELENYRPTQHYWMEKMAHHTIDVSNPESLELISQMIDEYVPLFRSNKLNICCDETFDLCKGKNLGKDPGEEYIKFLCKIINKAKEHGKTVQMWGDIILKNPETIKELPNDVVLLNWDYDAEPNDEGHCKFFQNAGNPYLVCPGTSTWKRFAEDVCVSSRNISHMANYGYKYGALGLLNTNWGDYNNVCSWYTSQIGVVIGAECSWNAENKISDEHLISIGEYVYGRGTKAYELVKAIGQEENKSGFASLVHWYSANYIENKKVPLNINAEACIKSIAECETLKEEFSKLGSDNDPLIGDMIIAIRAISIIKRVSLAICGKKEHLKSIAEEMPDFILNMRKAWLRDNKLSRLDMGCEFFNTILSVANQ